MSESDEGKDEGTEKETDVLWQENEKLRREKEEMNKEVERLKVELEEMQCTSPGSPGHKRSSDPMNTEYQERNQSPAPLPGTRKLK